MSPLKILIVDDDADVVLFLSTVLKDHGYLTIDAQDGQEGLEKAKSVQPDLILLDLMMPKKSGISMLSDLAGDGATEKIPVIMVTGVSGETGIDLETFFRGSSTGKQDRKAIIPEGFIKKPIDPEELIRLVRKAFK